jgi:hypothetical protein
MPGSLIFNWRLILSLWLPVSLLTLLILYDCLRYVGLPSPLQRVLRVVSSPFKNFLTVDDLEEPPKRTRKIPAWKNRALVALAISEAAAWLAYGLYVAVSEWSLAIHTCAVSFLVWVRANHTYNRGSSVLNSVVDICRSQSHGSSSSDPTILPDDLIFKSRTIGWC